MADQQAAPARMSGDERRESEIMSACLERTNHLIREWSGGRRWIVDRIKLLPRLSVVSADLLTRVERHTFTVHAVDQPVEWMAEMEAFLRRVFRRGRSKKE